MSRQAFHLELYGRPGCHLCEDLRALCERLGREFPLHLTEIDVDGDPTLAARYGAEVPILFIDGRKAVNEQIQRGTHYGACHELEVRWAELVQRLVPSAERVRFTSSGTEATHLALRLARAHTGKSKVVKFEGHFHGWHDYFLAGVKPPYDVPMSAGIPGESLAQVLLCPPNDLAAVEAVLGARQDVAAVILEPGGGSSGTIPSDPKYLQGLRDVTRRHGVVLIFDEVITGFRRGRSRLEPEGARVSSGHVQRKSSPKARAAARFGVDRRPSCASIRSKP